MSARGYGIAIFDQHAEMLAESAISPEVAHERGYRSVDTKTNLKAHGFTTAQQSVPGLLIPIHGPTSPEPVAYQYRPDEPRLDDKGRTVKYETPAGSRVVLDVPPRARERLADASVPLWITEGAKKADAAVTAGLCCVALSGVWCWRCTHDDGGKGPLPEWDHVRLDGRTVFVCFDNDVMTKPEVRRALDGLAEFLTGRGATVWIVQLPDDGAKVGLDDYLVAGHDADDLEALATRAEIHRDYKRTDIGNAARLVDMFGDGFRYVPEIGWHAWSGTRWERDAHGRIFEAAKKVPDAIWDEAGKAPSGSELKKELSRWAIQSESRQRVEAMVVLARTDPIVAATIDQLDRDGYLLNTTTGTVDLRTGNRRAHDPRDLITKVCGTGYDPLATAPTWDAFLHQIMNCRVELVDFLQRLVGYALIGETLENVLAIFVGMGANGKSTMLNALLDAFGDYGGTAEPDLLIAKRNDSHPTGVADLRGRRFVVAMESSKNRRLDEAVAKRLTGGDRIKARVMRGDFFEFTPSHTIVMATNDRPGVSDTTEGTWRRLRIIPFDVALAPEDQDHQLPTKLRAELPGILAWAVKGAQRYLTEGLHAPSAVTVATTEYRDEQNVVGRWLEDYIGEFGEGWKPAADMFAHYRIWTDRAGEEAGTQTAFGRELKRRGFESERHTIQGKSVRAWHLKDVPKPTVPKPTDDTDDGFDAGSGSRPSDCSSRGHTANASNASRVHADQLIAAGEMVR